MTQVAIIPSARTRDIFTLLEERLDYAGIDYSTHESITALLAESMSTRDLEVLVAPGQMTVDRSLLSLLPRLRGLVSPFIGVEGFALDAATELGVIVANGQTDENVESMAEATIMLILALSYELDRARALMDAAHLAGADTRLPRMVKGHTIGLVGYGRIAQAVATRLRPWGVTMLVATPHRRVALSDGMHYCELDELLENADIVSVHAPLTGQTKGLLNAARLASMKPDGALIVTSRGGIVDEAALAELCAKRPHYRIAIDTWSDEPPPADSLLRGIPAAILTPHTIGHTVEAIESLIPAAVDNIERILGGAVPDHLCNPGVLDTPWPRKHTTLPK